MLVALCSRNSGNTLQDCCSHIPRAFLSPHTVSEVWSNFSVVLLRNLDTVVDHMYFFSLDGENRVGMRKVVV